MEMKIVTATYLVICKVLYINKYRFHCQVASFFTQHTPIYTPIYTHVGDIAISINTYLHIYMY